MQEFNWNINSVRTKSILGYLKALLNFWKRNVQIQFSKEACERLKKSAISHGEYENYGHLCFKKETERIDVLYDRDTLFVLSFEINDVGIYKAYKPLKKPSKILRIIMTEREKKV